MQLRDYQTDGIDSIRQAYRQGFKCPLYVLPTGGGKTVLFSHMAKVAASRSYRVGVLMHRRELVYQTVEKLDGDCGVVMGGEPQNLSLPIQVLSVQTMVRRLDFHNNYDFLIIDEAHHAKASTYLKALEANAKARVLGVTATPCRGDGQGLGDLFDNLILGPSVDELTDGGYLSPLETWSPPGLSTEGIHSRGGDFIRSELESAPDRARITGCAVDHYRRQAHKQPAIVYGVSVQDVKNIASRFVAGGYVALPVYGSMPVEERKAAFAGLRNGTVDQLISCDLVSEGVDIPRVVCGIMLRPTESEGLYLQMIGRILRIFPGKEIAKLFDHAGNVGRHGLYNRDRQWSLDRVKRKPRETQQAVNVRLCHKCYFAHKPAPVCPECGFEYPIVSKEIEQVEGELVKITGPAAITADEIIEAGDVDGLTELAIKYNCKPGWVIQEYVKREGKIGDNKKIDILKQFAKKKGYHPKWVNVQARLRGIYI